MHFLRLNDDDGEKKMPQKMTKKTKMPEISILIF